MFCAETSASSTVGVLESLIKGGDLEIIPMDQAAAGAAAGQAQTSQPTQSGQDTKIDAPATKM